MKKIFTFVILALVAVSVWGSEVSVTIPESETTTTADFPITLTRGSWPNVQKVYQSKTQQLYLASDIGATNAGTIKSISFKSSNYGTATTPIDTRRNLIVYLQETDLSSLSSFVDYSSETPIFSAEHFEITSEKTFSFDNFEFNWGGTKNILITIIDQSNNYTASQAKTFVGYEPSTNNRGITQTFDFNGDACAPYSTPTVLNTIAQITFTIDASGSTTPSISTSTDALDFGSYYPAGETVSKTFTVSASNLTENISLSTTAAAGVTINPTSISKDNADLADKGVEVMVTLGAGYTFTSGGKLSITSDGASTKEVALSATEVRDEDFYKPSGYTFFTYENATKSPYIGYVYYNASKLTISEVNNNHFKPYGNATFTVDYSGVNIACAEAGKVSNLRGKFVNESEFKAFSFDYEAPELSAIVINENEDNSTDWPEAAQSGKELLITRTIVPNEWNSIVLPTDLTSTEVTNDFGSGTDVEEFTGAVVSSSNITLNFTKKTDGIVAGVPYLIKPTQALPNNSLHLTNHSFTPTASTVTNDGIEFVGVLVPTAMDAEGDDYIFVGANNTLFHPEGAGTIKGMRAYFHVVDETAKAAIRKSPMISLSTGSTGSTTAMTLVKPDAGKAYKAIENGRIVIKANGKKVNVLGQTVK